MVTNNLDFGVAIACAGAVAHGELVRDWRVPRSDQTARYTMGVTYSTLFANLRNLAAESKRKYGERAKTSLEVDGGAINVILDGKIIETHEEYRTFNSVFGLFVIGPNNAVTMRFPFSLAPQQDSSSLNRSVREWFKNRFKRAPQEWLEFNDRDWTIDRCARLVTGLGLGVVGSVLRLREGTACVVTWKGLQPGSMLVSVSRADGDPWMRPFIRRLCRSITEAALKRFNPDEPNSPKYAACILADRPAYVSAQESLSVDVYAVGPNNALARME